MAGRIATNVAGSPSSRESAELILGHLDRLPTLPAIAARLLAVTTSDQSSIRDAVAIVESDSSLTAAILRMTRRADLGVPTDSLTVAKAVGLLGFVALRNLVLSVQVYEALTPTSDNEHPAAVRKELWKHSLAVACAADMLARHLAQPEVSREAFVCGLLHDVGKIALDVSLPKSYARVIDRVERRRECICDVEREVLGMDHTVAGRRLLARWRLPQSIVECAWLHHQPPDALPSGLAQPTLVQLVHLADNLARRQRIGHCGYQHIGDVEVLAEQLGLPPTGVAEVAEQLPERMEPFREFLGLSDLDSRKLYAVSLAKANKELGTVNAELAESNRRLETRSACFEALNRFTGVLTHRDSIEDVCVAASESLGVMLGSECVLTLACGLSNGCFYIGRTDSGRSSGSVIDLRDVGGADGSWNLLAHGVGRGIVPVSAEHELAWQRCGLPVGPSPLWLLPLVDGESVVGTAIFTAGEQAVTRFRAACAECEALSAAMGLAISWAKARLESERMTEELLDLNRRCREAEGESVRVRSISMIAAMAAGAAHELNNPLSVISGRAQMLLAEVPDPEAARALGIIIEQAKRAAGIVTDLMDFAKPRAPLPTLQPLARVLESVCQYWYEGSTLRPDQLSLSLADESVNVYADVQHLQEILDAIVANAIEATKPETTCLQINSPSRSSDETVRIVMEDNGIGMTPNVLDHALDPFFSHRPAGRGRGLGLSRAYRLVEINGGGLWIESTPHVGTTVTIELPTREPDA